MDTFINAQGDEIPVGLCGCGCGERTQLARHDNYSRKGIVKGEPLRYIFGHQNRMRGVKSPEGYKWCPACKAQLPKGQFNPAGPHSRSIDGLHGYCKSCAVIKTRDYERRNPERTLEKRTELKLRKYGLTQADFDKMVERQGGVCAICKSPETYKPNFPKAHSLGKARCLCVDHDRETGKVRGLLCAHCNVAIGHMAHDIKTLQSAIRYLRKSMN